MNNALVLDSFALMAFWRDEPGAGKVERYLRRADTGEVSLAMSIINVGETLYLVERQHGEERARWALAFIQESLIQVYPASLERVLAAAHFKAHHPISYADAFAAALAEELGATLLTGDPEFKALEGRLSIEWLWQ